MGARGRALAVLLAFSAIGGFSVVASAPVLGATGFAVSQMSGPPGGFNAPVGLAVDGSAGASRGEVYVLDFGDETIDEFSVLGVWRSGVALPGAGVNQLTVDNYAGAHEGALLAAGFFSGTIYRFDAMLGSKEELVKGLVQPTDVAVDQAGDIFVCELSGKVLEYNSAGEPVDPEGHLSASNTVAEGLNSPQALAVDASGADVYVATGSGTIKYTLSADTYTQAGEPFDGSHANGVTVTASGDVYIDQGSQIVQYEAGGKLLASFGAGVLSGVAYGVGVNEETGSVYVADHSNNTAYVFEPGSLPEAPATEAAQLKGPVAALKGTLNGGGTEYYFQYNTGPTCEGGQRTASAQASSGPVQAELEGLLGFTRYSFCLTATNKYGTVTGATLQFTTGSLPPRVEGGSFSEVGATSVSLTGQVNTANVNSVYYYEYGTTSQFDTGKQQTTPQIPLPASGSSVPASAKLTGLAPNIEYHFRLIAKNITGEITEGKENTFSTLPAGSATLPDNRAYEMVTPPNNQNANVYIPRALFGGESISEGVPTQNIFQVSLEGSAVTYQADPTTGGYGIGGRGGGDQYLATRPTAGGWTQAIIQPLGITAGVLFQGFSSDLSVETLDAGSSNEPDVLPLNPNAPGGGYSVLYTKASNQNYFIPLFDKPSKRTAAEFGTHNVVNVGRNERTPVFAGMSSAAQGLLFEANDALLEGNGLLEKELATDVEGEITAGGDNNYLYDWVGGRLGSVDVLPDGRMAPDATFGAAPFGKPRSNPPDFGGVISGDGSRVFWTDLNAPETVYVRVGGVETLRVSGGHAARYWASGDDGRYAFYTEEGGLYRFDVVHNTREAFAEPSAGVLGVLGASEDGGSVYAVAKEVLGSGVSSEGAIAVKGQRNLYLLRDGQTPVFIGTLSERDGNEVFPFEELRISGAEYGDWQPGLGQRTAEVAPGGGPGGVVFMSDQRLPVVGFPGGYPNPGGLDEVYLFDAGADRLFCVSCGSSGEAPSGSEEGAAAFLPVSWDDTYMPQWVSEGGDRVFFDSAVPLVPQDTNGRQDVYEWEREGSGSCAPGSGADGGCLFLLSGGTSESDSWFIGAGVSGDDAFVVTRAQLVAGDRNEAFDLYDARVGGVESVEAPACTGTGCQGLPSPAPTFATPASATFNGVGNFAPEAPTKKAATKQKAKVLTRAQRLTRALNACRRKPKGARRIRCERAAHSRYSQVVKQGRTGKR